MWLTLFEYGADLGWATLETIYMVGLSTLCALILGIPLGVYLFICDAIAPKPQWHKLLSSIINITRSIPFIILLVALIPLTRILVGTSIGIHAAMVPLSLGATPFVARLVYNVFQTLPRGLIETGRAAGANTWQMIYLILYPEALPALIQVTTLTAITLVNYSAMAGTVGGGGLGDLAIRYGYQRFNPGVMLATVIVLIIIVQLLQMLGDKLSRYYTKGARS